MWDLLIFDLDGTLIDSRADIAAGINHALAAHDAAPADEAAVYPYIGTSLEATFSGLAPGLSDAAYAAMVVTYKAYYFDHCDVHTRPYPGVDTTLAKMNGTPKAIGTTKRTFMARRVTERLGIAGHFDLVQGTDEGVPLKPAPDLFLGILAHFGAEAHRTLVVGDTDHDMLAGRAAGCVTAGVTYGIRSRGELAACEPDHLVDRFADLLALVQGAGSA